MNAILADLVAAQWGQLGPAFTPDDVYAFTRAGIADCLDNGVTTVFDWCHVINSPAHAEAAVAAHQSLGIRAVFGYGGSMNQKVREMAGQGDANDWSHAASLYEREFAGRRGRLTMALAPQGLDYTTLETTVRDVETARRLGMPMSFHVGVPMGGKPKESVRRMAEAGLLGPDMSFAHCCDITDEEVKLAMAVSAHLVSCPIVDAALGMGSTPTPRMRHHGMRPCFSADSVTATSGDMFEEARTGLLLDRYEASRLSFAEGIPVPAFAGRMTAREALEAITIAGAEACWLDSEIGSVTPGKQADLILLRATDFNLWPLSNLEPAVIAGAHGANVDTVLVEGDVVKTSGSLVGVDIDVIRTEVVDARNRLYNTSGYDDIIPKDYR